MLTESQRIKLHALIALIDKSAGTPLELIYDQEFVRDSVDKILKEK